jgi:hypothetical protein
MVPPVYPDAHTGSHDGALLLVVPTVTEEEWDVFAVSQIGSFHTAYTVVELPKLFIIQFELA